MCSTNRLQKSIQSILIFTTRKLLRPSPNRTRQENYAYQCVSYNKTKYEPRLPHSILEITSERRLHPTQKPVGLIEFFLKYFTKAGDVVLDPTMGSGSTGVACQNMDRNFIGIEQDVKIFAVAQTRLNK
jgi:DNA modification methylase